MSDRLNAQPRVRRRLPARARAVMGLAFLVGGLAPSACALSTPGELGKLEFRILVDDTYGGSSEMIAIAPNTEAIVKVTRGGMPALITDYRTDEPWVLAVTRESSDELRVRALAVGDAKLLVRAAGEDDRVRLSVLAPVAARVWGPPGSPGEELVALRGERARLPLTLTGPQREEVLSLGVQPPIRVVPAGAATIEAPGPRSGTVVDVTFVQTGVLRLEGDLEPALTIRVITEDELESVELVRVGADATSNGMMFEMRATIAGKPVVVVSTGAKTEIHTPEHCTAAPLEPVPGIFRFAEGYVLATAIASGRCAGTVTFGSKSAAFSGDLVAPPDRPREDSVTHRVDGDTKGP